LSFSRLITKEGLAPHGGRVKWRQQETVQDRLPTKAPVVTQAKDKKALAHLFYCLSIDNLLFFFILFR
jgi:hypothetical protein